MCVQTSKAQCKGQLGASSGKTCSLPNVLAVSFSVSFPLLLYLSLYTHMHARTCLHSHARARANTFITGSVKCAYTLEASMAGGYIDSSGASSSNIDSSGSSGSYISSSGASGTDSTDGATRCHCHFSPTMLQDMGKQFLLGFLVSDWYTSCATHTGSHTANCQLFNACPSRHHRPTRMFTFNLRLDAHAFLLSRSTIA